MQLIIKSTNQLAKVIKGENKGITAIVTSTREDYIGTDKVYELKDLNGNKLWNGSFSWFPESFVEIQETYNVEKNNTAVNETPLSCQAALDMYDSLGGCAKGYAVISIK